MVFPVSQSNVSYVTTKQMIERVRHLIPEQEPREGATS
jgi:hypothetical protein